MGKATFLRGGCAAGLILAAVSTSVFGLAPVAGATASSITSTDVAITMQDDRDGRGMHDGHKYCRDRCRRCNRMCHGKSYYRCMRRCAGRCYRYCMR